MAKSFDLGVTPRTVTGKEVSKLRKDGIVPGVVYGWRVSESTPVQVDARTFESVYRQAGSNSLINLSIEGGKPGAQVVIHRITRDPVTRQLNHFDLMAVNPRAEMSAEVPVVLTGEAPGAENSDLVLLHELNTVHMRGLPSDLPSTVIVDISGLVDAEHAIHVKDLDLPSNVTILTDPEQLVVKLTQLRVSAADRELEAEAAAVAEAASAAHSAEVEAADADEAAAADSDTDTDTAS